MSFIASLGLGVLALLVFLLLLWLIGYPGRRRARRLMESTVFGQASVNNVVAENVMSKGPRYVRYEVTITPASGGASYDAATSVVATAIDMPALNVGRSFPVQIDPEDPKHFRFTHNH